MGLSDLNVFGMSGFRGRTTGYTNVYVSHKIINSVRNGACSQTFGGVFKYFTPVILIQCKSLISRTSGRFCQAARSCGPNHITNEAWGSNPLKNIWMGTLKF